MDEESLAGARPRSTFTLALLGLLSLMLFAGFVALGIWQLQRLHWKQALIQRVEQRVHAAPTDAPGPRDWPRVDAEHDEYRRLHIKGRFLHEHESLVQAVTEHGPGWWLLTPLQTGEGFIVLINRGFVDDAHRDRATRTTSNDDGKASVNGLLRLSEPGGGFLRRNDATQRRWYSRDVAAIAAAQSLPKDQVAPYFIDADADPASDAITWPVGGLTVLHFHDNHRVYAITWFSLAALTLLAIGLVGRRERRLRAARASSGTLSPPAGRGLG